jgi:hypothetical protein
VNSFAGSKRVIQLHDIRVEMTSQSVWVVPEVAVVSPSRSILDVVEDATPV